MNTADILDGYERCARIPFWGRDWEKGRLSPQDMLDIGVRAGLTCPIGDDPGMTAGEELYSLGATREIESKQHDLHAQVVHLSSIADLVTTAIRKPTDEPWRIPEPLDRWKSECFLSPDGMHLRKVVFVTSWSSDRHYSLCRSWSALGEVCHHNFPMQLIVVMLGKHLNGRFHSYWSHGLTHPVNKKLRFRKKQNIGDGFKDSWREIFREDHDEIDTKTWLNAMISDDVIRDVLFKIDIPVPEKLARQQIVDLANRKLDRIAKLKVLPDPNLSTCDWPSPCSHRRHCHANEEPSGRYGFVPVDSLNLR
jgi:hypothetical protein